MESHAFGIVDVVSSAQHLLFSVYYDNCIRRAHYVDALAIRGVRCVVRSKDIRFATNQFDLTYIILDVQLAVVAITPISSPGVFITINAY